MYHTRHHSFPDTDPYKVNDALDALRERLGIHAQLEKQEALDTLLGEERVFFFASCVIDPSSALLTCTDHRPECALSVTSLFTRT